MERLDQSPSLALGVGRRGPLCSPDRAVVDVFFRRFESIAGEPFPRVDFLVDHRDRVENDVCPCSGHDAEGCDRLNELPLLEIVQTLTVVRSSSAEAARILLSGSCYGGFSSGVLPG